MENNTEDKENENRKLGEHSENTSLYRLVVKFSLEEELSEEDVKWFKERINLGREKKKKKPKKEPTVRKPVLIVRADGVKRVSEKPNKCIIRLQETDTIWLLTLDNRLSLNDLEDAERVRSQNESYEMKKTKIEVIRRRRSADSQTPQQLAKSRGTQTEDILKEEKAMFASDWDLHDTYKAFDESDWTSAAKYLTFVDSKKPSKGPPEPTDSAKLSAEEQADKTFASSEFKYATLVMERLLASNCFQEVQTVFKGKPPSRYEAEPTNFSYLMTPLWNYDKDLKSSLAVTDLDWNPLNKDLLAVGYGNLSFHKLTPGLVCIWSPKNPRQPERQFFIEESVTCLNYSKTKPNLLAAGTRRGSVYVMDISGRVGFTRIIGSDEFDVKPEPIWKIEWFQCREIFFKTEELLVLGDSGVLMLFSLSTDETITDILKLDYVVSGKKLLRKKSERQSGWRSVQKINLSYDRKRYSGSCFSLFYDRYLCYIATNEGVLVKCSFDNPLMKEDSIFLAHDGPVYTVQHSPATGYVFLTCGADWCIRIWMDGITEALIVLQHNSPVRCARWSPLYPTVIASISDTEVRLWDIARNTLSPMSRRIFESRKPLTTLSFSADGQKVVVGGEDGLVRVVHLTELPRIPFLQKEALINAIKSALYGNKKLAARFSRAVALYKDELKTKVELK